MGVLSNPVIISVIVMSALCLMKLNVLLSLLVAAVVGGTHCWNGIRGNNGCVGRWYEWKC